MTEKRAIIVISIGERPWFKKNRETIETYAAKCSAEFILYDKPPSHEAYPMPPLANKPGRSHKYEYSLKQYFPGLLLSKGFERVVVMDDTCIVTPNAPDIFEQTPRKSCGYTITSSAHAEDSFKAIRKFTTSNDLPPIPERAAHYMNTGVMVYDQNVKKALSRSEIIKAKDVLYSSYPDQTLAYYLLKKFSIPMHRLDKRFNLSNPFLCPMEEVDMNNSELADAYIYHITGGWGENRGEMIEVLTERVWGAPREEQSP